MDEDVDSDRDDDDYDVHFASGFRGVVNDGEDDEEDKNDDDDNDDDAAAAAAAAAFDDDDDDEEEDGFRGGRVRGENYHEVWKMDRTKTNMSKQNIVQNTTTEYSSKYNYLMLGL